MDLLPAAPLPPVQKPGRTAHVFTAQGGTRRLSSSAAVTNWAIPPVRLGISGRNSGRIPERPGNALRAFPGIPLESTAGIPKPYNSRHLRFPEHFQNSLPPRTAGDASFFSSGSGEGLSEPVMEFPATLRVFLTFLWSHSGTRKCCIFPEFCSIFEGLVTHARTESQQSKDADTCRLLINLKGIFDKPLNFSAGPLYLDSFMLRLVGLGTQTQNAPRFLNAKDLNASPGPEGSL